MAVGFEEGIDPSDSEAYLVAAGVLVVEIDPSDSEACLAVVEVFEEETGPFDLGACLAEEGIGLVECFVVAGHPWRFVEAPREEVPRLVLGPFLVVDGLLLLKQHQSFGHPSLLDHRGQQTQCLRNFLRGRLLDEHRILGRKYCH